MSIDNFISIILSSILTGGAVTVIIWKVANKFGQVLIDLSLKKYQQVLDREKILYSKRNEKQLNAIHECYSHFVHLNSFLLKSRHGDKYEIEHRMPKDNATMIIKLRNNFLEAYEPNRIVFTEQLCTKIDKLLPAVDKFIDTYRDGILPVPSPDEIEEMGENKSNVIITAMWAPNAFDDVMDELEKVKLDIEKEFRVIYGTKE